MLTVLSNDNLEIGFTMKKSIRQILLCGVLLVMPFVGKMEGQDSATRSDSKKDSSTVRVSKFGEYSGYSQERFSEWHTTSQYIEMADGIRLAIDIVRPAKDGHPVDETFPVILTLSRYHRGPEEMMKYFSGETDLSIPSSVDAIPDLQRLVKHGYCFVAVGVRGSGASFGRFTGLVSPSETNDSYEVIDWISKQPWCSGKVGMHGASYLGMTQYMAASKAHPALKAIFPNVAGFDLYDTVYPGGVFREDMVAHWSQLTQALDTTIVAPKVSTDQSGELRKQAVQSHDKNWIVAKGYRESKFRDSSSDGASYSTHNLSPFLARINEAKVPAYHWGGWYDIFVNDELLWYANYEGPQKMAIGSWPHAETTDPSVMEKRIQLRGAEQHRWFDYWLKGVENGIMKEAPINIGTLIEPGKEEWSALKQWPAASAKATTFYFSGINSSTINSSNDGTLSTDAPGVANKKDKYEINYATTTGSASRWDNAVGAGTMIYPDMTSNDTMCLTYTTTPMASDMNVTGHPIVTLFVESEAKDADFYVLLEEVDAKGKSHYVSEGVLRASHRAESTAPWNNLGLPFQRSNQMDRQPLPEGKPTQIRLDLNPISNVFNKGNRLRLAIMGADKDNTEQPPVEDGTKVWIHRSKQFPSRIELPVIQNVKANVK